jgi:hypothetical protein
MTHLGYQKRILAGEKRINLDGETSGVITEYDQRVAQKKVETIEAKMKRDREATSAAAAVLPPVRFGTALPDFIRQIESTPAMSKTPPTITPSAAAPVIVPELMPVYEAMLSANAAMSLPMQSSEMRRAIVDAVIGVIMKEAQAVRDRNDGATNAVT